MNPQVIEARRQVSQTRNQVALQLRRLADEYDLLAKRERELWEAESGVPEMVAAIHPAFSQQEPKKERMPPASKVASKKGTIAQQCLEVITQAGAQGVTSTEVVHILSHIKQNAVTPALSHNVGKLWAKRGNRFYPL